MGKLNVDTMKEMLSRGDSVKEIAYVLDCSMGSIYTAKSRLGLVAGPISHQTRKLIAEFYRDNTAKATAKKFNVSAPFIYKVGREFGISKNGQGVNPVKRSLYISKRRRELPKGLYYNKRDEHWIPYDGYKYLGCFHCFFQAWMALVMYKAGEWEPLVRRRK